MTVYHQVHARRLPHFFVMFQILLNFNWLYHVLYLQLFHIFTFIECHLSWVLHIFVIICFSKVGKICLIFSILLIFAWYSIPQKMGLKQSKSHWKASWKIQLDLFSKKEAVDKMEKMVLGKRMFKWHKMTEMLKND